MDVFDIRKTFDNAAIEFFIGDLCKEAVCAAIAENITHALMRPGLQISSHFLRAGPCPGTGWRGCRVPLRVAQPRLQQHVRACRCSHNSPPHRKLFYHVNVEGTKTLLGASKLAGVKVARIRNVLSMNECGSGLC